MRDNLALVVVALLGFACFGAVLAHHVQTRTHLTRIEKALEQHDADAGWHEQDTRARLIRLEAACGGGG